MREKKVLSVSNQTGLFARCASETANSVLLVTTVENNRKIIDILYILWALQKEREEHGLEEKQRRCR